VPLPPVVSVVLPTYNRTTLLRDAVDSVVNQTWQDWELIVVDDGSTVRVEDWLSPDARIHVVHLVHSGSIARGRNTGLSRAAGEYVGFLDTDDRWHPRKLELQVARLEGEPRAGWCHGEAALFDGVGGRIPQRAGPPWQPREGWFVETMIRTDASIALQTVLVSRELAQSTGFDERIFVDDYDFLLQLALRAPAVAIGECVLAEIREHDGRTRRGRYDHGLGSALAYRKAHRRLTDRHLRRVCFRQGARLLRHYLANARARGEWWRSAALATRQLWSI
jgi:glycosyltransferase involved in cell wall biosynthesis